MHTTKKSLTQVPGASFLIENQSIDQIFTPEEFSEDQLMVRQMVRDFVEQEMKPFWPEIEKQEGHHVERILEKAGELGILGAHMPEEFGGMDLDTQSNTLIAFDLGASGSASVALAAHTGIGMLPIFYFGTDAQRKKYLPELITGKLKASYCLTEPGSGSDALAAKTRADLSQDGSHYLLNGQKMWITNAGFADIYIVFAQVGGDQFTAFIVERNTPGLTLGAEEHKMGIHGSSTRMVFLENVKVPVDQVLGEIGKGHLIAFNALNIGRYKLGAMTAGGLCNIVSQATQYAKERIQFKVPIATFGAIQFKLGEMAIRAFAAQSALYRTSFLMHNKKEELLGGGMPTHEAQLTAAEEYAIECSILKVTCSEALSYGVDENVQIHGGMGFSEESLAARAYRDCRINRIYEGTNEINRLLIIDMLLKRALKGRIDVTTPAWQVQKELASMPSFEIPSGPFGEEIDALQAWKKMLLMTAGAAVKQQMDGQLKLQHEQEILMNIADMISDIYLAESTYLRIKKILENKWTNIPEAVYQAICKTLFHDTQFRLQKNATDALTSFASGDLLKTMLLGVKRFSKYPPQNVRNHRRTIAEALIQGNGWLFN